MDGLFLVSVLSWRIDSHPRAGPTARGSTRRAAGAQHRCGLADAEALQRRHDEQPRVGRTRVGQRGTERRDARIVALGDDVRRVGHVFVRRERGEEGAVAADGARGVAVRVVGGDEEPRQQRSVDDPLPHRLVGIVAHT